MSIKKNLYCKTLAKAQRRAMKVYRHSREHPGAERSAAYALGRYEGLKEATRLLAKQGRDAIKSSFVGPPSPDTPAFVVSSPFSGIFQNPIPAHDHKALGSL